MKKMMTGIVLAALVFGGFGTAGAKPYTSGEIVALTKKLAKKRRMSGEHVATLLMKLRKTFKTPWFKKTVKALPVMGVFVYRAGEGGLIVKFMKGDGYLSFSGGKQAGQIYMKSVSVGAQIGGSARWGVGLVMGLKKPDHFGGRYSGKVVRALAVHTATAGGLLLTGDNHQGTANEHKIYMISTGRGLSASAGVTKITFTRGW